LLKQYLSFICISLANNTGTIGTDSCIGANACCGNIKNIGNNECNVDDKDYDEAHCNQCLEKTQSPTAPEQTSEPSQSPTNEPTESCPASPDNCLPNACDGVCKGAIGTIGSNSCFGNENAPDAASCVNLNGTVGNNSCHGNMTCMDLTGEYLANALVVH